jgi:hypothetical protein
MKEPYVSLYKRLNGFKVYIVDGEFIRTEKDIEFTNFGQHYKYSYIPKNEIWLDETNSQGEDEYKYYVQHALIEYSLMSRGFSYHKASDMANKVEKAARQRDLDNRPIHKKMLGRIGKLKIWLVEGEQVRDKKDVEFTEGGNDLAYRYIPKDQIWIDDSLKNEGRPPVVLHEVYERQRMAQGEDYEEAHSEASKVEKKARKKKGWKKWLPMSLPGIKKTKKA